MISSLIEKYRAGKLTANHTAVEIVCLIDPLHPELALQGLPVDLMSRIQGFAEAYRPNEMVSNFGAIPTKEQVESAKKWIETNLEVHK